MPGALRDALSEAAFFQVYGNLFAFRLPEDPDGEQAPTRDPRELPLVKKALAAIDQGGYAEALARVAFLMAHHDEPLPLSRLHLANDLLEDYRDLLPVLPTEEVRRIAGEQEIIARHEPERAIATLPVLLAKKDRDRLLTLLDRVLADRRVQRIQPTAQQTEMLARIRSVLGAAPTPLGAVVARRAAQGGHHCPTLESTRRAAARATAPATPSSHSLQASLMNSTFPQDLEILATAPSTRSPSATAPASSAR